jgi:hypothetical protein
VKIELPLVAVEVELMALRVLRVLEVHKVLLV